MLITEFTKYSDVVAVERFFDDETVKRIKTLAQDKLGSFYDLPFGTFYACQSGDFSHLGDMSDPTVLQVYWCKMFGEESIAYLEKLKGLAITPTAKEERARQGLLRVDFFEAMLVFMQKWFGLKSYREAEQITLGDLLIAKRAEHNEIQYNRNMTAIRRSENKK